MTEPMTKLIPFPTINFNEQIATCLQNFEQFYTEKRFEEAFEQLYLAMTLLEHTTDSQLMQDVLTCCVKASAIVMSIQGSESVVSSALAMHTTIDHFENLSMCYYLLSQAMLLEKQYDEAIMHAKMAYFYAQQITGERYFYECNAQLQLVCTLLEAKQLTEAKDYIRQFNWYLAHCTNDAERVFVLAIQASLQLLDDEQDTAVATMNMLLDKFQQSQDVMYTSFLAMHFKRMLQLTPEYGPQYQAIIDDCEQIIAQFTQLSQKISTAIAQNYTVHSNYFYRRAYEIVEELKNVQLGTYLVKFTLTNEPDVIERLLASYKEHNFIHLLYQYAYGHFMFITSADAKMLCHSFIQSEKSATLIHSVQTEHAQTNCFLDLYNELNATILRKNFA